MARYALASRAHKRLFKTGSGKDPWERLRSEERKHEGLLDLYVAGIWWNEGHLEHAARAYLREMPPEELGVRGTEYRMTSFAEICDATCLARRQLEAAHPVQSEQEAEVEREATAFKRRREAADVEEREPEVSAKRLQLEKAKLEVDFLRCDLVERQRSLGISP